MTGRGAASPGSWTNVSLQKAPRCFWWSLRQAELSTRLGYGVVHSSSPRNRGRPSGLSAVCRLSMTQSKVTVKASARKRKQPEPLVETKTTTKTVFELPEKQVAEEADEEEEDA